MLQTQPPTSDSAATRPKDTRQEAAEVVRCLQEALRDPTFVSAVAVLVLGRDADRRDLEECLGSGSEAK